jgi:hypothetical protein
VKSFKDYITERRGLYMHYNQQKDGTYKRREHRHLKDDVGASNATNPNMKFAHRVVSKWQQSKKVIKNGPISQQDAESIAKTHGINLATMNKKGKVLRGTKPQEILMHNPDKDSPFPYIKKTI